MVVKNGHGTLKFAVSQEWINEMSWFFACWYKFRNAKGYFDDYWVAIVKNEWGLIDHRTHKSGVPLKWFDELSRLIEQFYMLIMMESFLVWWPIYSVSLYIAKFFRKNFLWAKMTLKQGFFFILKYFVIDFCWKCT